MVKDRLNKFEKISSALSNMSDAEIYNIINKTDNLHVGIGGGKSRCIDINETKTFIKMLPLTDLEFQKENIHSTANIFNLPMFYHIGVGSAGFSAWRELLMHEMSTKWVLSGKCSSFPLMYHWRKMATGKPNAMTKEEMKKLDSDVQYWDNSASVRNRLEQLHNASNHLCLFLEYIPDTLDSWLSKKIKRGDESAADAVQCADTKLRQVCKFLLEQRVIHFDAHLDNILADDDDIYFSDFGLSLTDKFDCEKDELSLFERYDNFDTCSTITNLLHSVVGALTGKDRWEVFLKDVSNEEISQCSKDITGLIQLYKPIAIAMDEYFISMQKKSKSTFYPKERLDKLLLEIEDGKKYD